MCCSTGTRTRPAPMRAHHKSLSVDSFFFSQEITGEQKEYVANTADKPFNLGISTFEVDDRCPSPLRERAKTESFRDVAPPVVSKPQQKARKAKKSVKFSRVEVRSFNLVIGDHPSCTYGLPLSLGWERTSDDTCTTVDDYESKKGAKKATSDLQLSRNCRRKRLAKFGSYTDKEIFLEDRKAQLKERSEFFGL